MFFSLFFHYFCYFKDFIFHWIPLYTLQYFVFIFILQIKMDLILLFYTANMFLLFSESAICKILFPAKKLCAVSINLLVSRIYRISLSCKRSEFKISHSKDSGKYKCTFLFFLYFIAEKIHFCSNCSTVRNNTGFFCSCLADHFLVFLFFHQRFHM